MQEPATAFPRLRFGEFEVDLRIAELRRHGEKIKLQQRPFQILAALLERPGEVVTRESIQLKLWPTDTFVDFEHSINTAVNKLREALGDDAETPRFIETLPRYGYRFIAPVERIEAQSSRSRAGLRLVLPHQEMSPEKPPQKRWIVGVIGGALAVLVAAPAVILYFHPFPWHRAAVASSSAWVQITQFADGATQPVFSPDGRMIAFIRGPETFVTPGQIYVKVLPDGNPVRLTHDDELKMAPAFSPDGSRIAYTVTEKKFEWNTWVVPVLGGGEPQEILPNAAALTWTDKQHILFSRIKGSSTYMSLATAQENRTGERDVYLPEGWGMAHRSWLSPDGKLVLISEMNLKGWAPCRVLPFDGSTSGETAGPKGARCTYAGWSPDGKTMYFSADAGDGFHIWRQRFPKGAPEQLTFGLTEEEGIAVSPDGQSLVTSAGFKESTVWVHDARGDRQVSGEGSAMVPGWLWSRTVFSPDGKKLFYLTHRQGNPVSRADELWMADLDSGRSEAVLPGVSVNDFDIAPDGKRVAFTVLDGKGNPHLSVAPLDHHSPPKQVTSFIADRPSFSLAGDLYFRMREDGRNMVYDVGPDEAAPRKMSPEPVGDWGFDSISPRGDMWVASSSFVHVAPGAPPTRNCGICSGQWGPGGKFLYIRFRDIGYIAGGKTIAIALPAGKELPDIPPTGFNSPEDVKGVNVAAEIDMKDKTTFAPGPDPSIYAYVKVIVQRNLFRIPLR